METELPKYLPYQKIKIPLDRETTAQVTLTHEQMKLLTNLCIEYHNDKGKFGNVTPRHDTLINLFNAHTQIEP